MEYLLRAVILDCVWGTVPVQSHRVLFLAPNKGAAPSTGTQTSLNQAWVFLWHCSGNAVDQILELSEKANHSVEALAFAGEHKLGKSLSELGRI